MTPWTVAHQAPPSMGFSRQEYWSGLPCPPSVCSAYIHPTIHTTHAIIFSLAHCSIFYKPSCPLVLIIFYLPLRDLFLSVRTESPPPFFLAAEYFNTLFTTLSLTRSLLISITSFTHFCYYSRAVLTIPRGTSFCMCMITPVGSRPQGRKWLG